jgi:pyruvate kinase|tara:strand:- start:207 stop:1220 length:1014 start_codon:yes stop_codon:yes gene_type:complete
MCKKILVTLGPASMKKDIIAECEDLGVYLYRINLSHTPVDEIISNIEKIRGWTNIPICLDSEGAQLRNQKMVSESVLFKVGGEVYIHFDPVVGDENNISFSPVGIARQFVVGDKISIDFNQAQLSVIEINKDRALAKVVSGGKVGSNKAADSQRALKFDPLTIKDFEAIKIGLDLNICNFALSFANTPEDVELMRSLCGKDANIICKIESPHGLVNLDGIIDYTDEILIDRGDLSRKISIEKIPFLQRKIISIARSRKTPVFVATNLLESMVKNNFPNRAEVNDVVSTLLMGADGLVLAAETAIGNFPVEAVTMIRNLIDESENWIPDASLSEIMDV